VAHRYRLYPAAAQEPILELHCRHARLVWNTALEQWRQWRPGRQAAPGPAERMRQLAEARQEMDWLAVGSSSVQQQALRDFDQAVRNFFAGTHRRPRWRKRGRDEGFCIRDVRVRKLNLKWAEVAVPKAGRVRFRLSRALPAGKLGMARVTRDGKGRWHISFPLPQVPVERAVTGRAAGIDRGVVITLATSDGQMLRAPVMGARNQRRLTRLERQKARQRKGSSRRERTKRQIARLHQQARDRRRDWVERTSTRLVRDYDFIAVERLNVKGMVRRPAAKPDPGNPGSYLSNGAGGKTGLNRAIHAQGWSMWLRRLQAKAEASGVTVVEVDPRHTSDECRACGYTAPENRKSQAVFWCRICGHAGHADTEAANKILARALRLAPTPGPGVTGTQPVPAQAHRLETVAAGTTGRVA
jgi:putative transposase